MQKLRPKSPNGANSPSFYSSSPITTFDHTQISLLPVPKFQPASGKPRPRAGVLKVGLAKLLPKNVFVIALLQQPRRLRKLRSGRGPNDVVDVLSFTLNFHRIFTEFSMTTL